VKAVVTGGGTGGHIYPALAVAGAIQQRVKEAELLYIGGRSGMESEIVPATGTPYRSVTSRKLRRLLSFSTLGVLWALAQGYREACEQLRAFQPDVVIGTGGYVPAATVMAAVRLRIPTIILGPDAVPGRTNRWLSRWVSRICIWFEETAAFFPSGKTVITGVPIRADIVSPESVAGARRRLSLAEDRFTILVLGGSQGAQRLNEIVVDAAAKLPGAVQILHQTGERNLQAVKAQAERVGLPPDRHFPRAYLDGREVPLAYRAAELVICRCGVSTLAEVTANGLPSLLVPLPTAYADHQTANAKAIARGGGGIHLPQVSLTPESLTENIETLRNNPTLREAISVASRAIGKPDAAERVASLALELAGARGWNR
jgi:UDP-N-acetylglucosamine--N-acetylmuramyl-(pentapeptide) pyrophosphoryl-undecaprenol N-acetylglucosamine transferase